MASGGACQSFFAPDTWRPPVVWHCHAAVGSTNPFINFQIDFGSVNDCPERKLMPVTEVKSQKMIMRLLCGCQS
jgi:hypothetical protein